MYSETEPSFMEPVLPLSLPFSSKFQEFHFFHLGVENDTFVEFAEILAPIVGQWLSDKQKATHSYWSWKRVFSFYALLTYMQLIDIETRKQNDLTKKQNTEILYRFDGLQKMS